MLGNGLNIYIYIYLIYSDIMSKRNPYPSSYNRDSQAEKQPASNSFRHPQKAWRMPLSATNSVMFFSQQMPEIRYDRVIETYDQQCPASIAPDLLYEILKHAYVKSLMENQHLRKRLGSLCKWTLSIFLELYRSMCYRFVGSNRSFIYSIHNEGCKASAEIIHEFRFDLIEN